MPDGGTLTIKSSFNEEENEIVVTVEDTGIGISDEQIKKIWEPFISFKASAHGVTRGLGLSIVFRIMQEHLGHIWVSSTLGKGTIFTLTFPVKK